MTYILILTLAFGNSSTSGSSGQGGAGISMQEFNTVQACAAAGELWKKRNNLKKYSLMNDDIHMDYFCAPKGELE